MFSVFPFVCAAMRSRLVLRRRMVLALVTSLSGSSLATHATEPPVPIQPGFVAHAPPPTPPALSRRPQSGDSSKRPSDLSAPPGLTLYSIGEPTDEEQLYLENINRARSDPAGEGLRFQASTDPEVLRNYEAFGVDLPLMVQQFADLAEVPPLSMSAKLTAAARQHSQDMLDNAFQGHNGSDGSSFDTRAAAAGYTWSYIAENVYAYAHSVGEGHAGFEVDWGGDASTGGMQNPPGHRENIHDLVYREVGIGVVHGTNGDVGPQLVTQDFGSQFSATPFITGVVYYDLNGNGSYDAGEGVGGVTVRAAGSGYYAVTAQSGGYSVPVSGDGRYAVTFSVPGLADTSTSADVSNNSNVKMDHVPPYTPPVVSGPGQLGINQAGTYSFTRVAAAIGYQWQQARLVPFTGTIGAEDGLADVTAATTAGYSVIDNTLRNSGQNSFHLAHPTVQNSRPEVQSLTLNGTFQAGPDSELRFTSRLGWASTQQVARAQISPDNGENWQDVWSQSGLSDAGEESFSIHTVPLGQWAGQELRVRFVYDYLGGVYYTQTDPGVGFYLDDVTLDLADQVVDTSVQDISVGTTFTFAPAQPERYALRVRPKLPGRLLTWGPPAIVSGQTSTVPGNEVHIVAVTKLPDLRLQIEFTVADPAAGGYSIQGAPDPAGPWTQETSAAMETVPGTTNRRAVVMPGGGGSRFYRIASQ